MHIVGWVIEIGLVALAAHWISDAIGVNFWFVVIAAVGLYLAITKGKGLGLLRPATPAAGGGFHPIAGARTLLVGFATFTGVMMIGTYVIRVSNNFAFDQFSKLGWRIWLWPAGVSQDLLMWVCLAFIAAWIASEASKGNAKIAGAIFITALVVMFIVKMLPRTGEMARPKAATPMTVKPIAAPTTKWEEADQAASEGRGFAPVAIETAKKAVVGDNVSRRTGTLVRETVGGFWEGLFPPPPKSTKSQATYHAPAPVAPIKVPSTHMFGADGCVNVPVDGNVHIDPIGVGEVIATPPGKKAVAFDGDPNSPTKSSSGVGTWGFCRGAGSSVTGVIATPK